MNFLTILLILGTPATSTEANACLQCHGNQKAPMQITGTRAPLWPQFFSMDWKMYEFQSKKSPPFDKIPKPHSVSRGKTYYNWAEKKMIEIYFDRCIDIFSRGNNFSCKFISVGDQTYFMKFKLRDLRRAESCCRWSDDGFFAPRPDVLRHMKFQKRSKSRLEKDIDWWIYDIPIPGPFGYGTRESSGEPVAFWFPVINGWVQQNFSNYSREKPDAQIFELPPSCKEPLPLCEND